MRWSASSPPGERPPAQAARTGFASAYVSSVDPETRPALDAAAPKQSKEVLLGLLGVVVTCLALWLTSLLAFGVLLASDCAGPHGASVIAKEAVAGAGITGAVALTWLAGISLMRASVGRRWPRLRTWLAVPLILAAPAGAYFGIAMANAAPPSATCQPFSLD